MLDTQSCSKAVESQEPSERDYLLERIYGLTEKELIYSRAAWRLLTRQPCEVPPKPSIDVIAVWFLRKQGIDICPPSKPRKAALPSRNKTNNAILGGTMGALGGPLAVGIQSHLSQQQNAANRAERLSLYAAEMSEYAAAKQEWTAWKQWSLSHQDWPQFLDDCIQEWEEDHELALRFNESFEDWIRSDEGLLERRELIRLADSHRNTIKIREKKRRIKRSLFFLFCFLAIVIAGIVVTIAGLNPFIGALLITLLFVTIGNLRP